MINVRESVARPTYDRPLMRTVGSSLGRLAGAVLLALLLAALLAAPADPGTTAADDRAAAARDNSAPPEPCIPIDREART